MVVETSSRPGSAVSGFRRFWTITMDDEEEDRDDDDKDNGVDKNKAATTDQRSSTVSRGGGGGVKKNDKPQQARKTHCAIVFLDAGIATSLQPNDLKNLLDLIRAVVLNRGEDAGRLMIERAKYERCSQTPGGVQAFCQGIAAIVAEFHHDALAAPLSEGKVFMGLTLANVRVGALLSRVLDLCRIHGVEIDPAMATLVLSVLVLEGLGRSLDPTFNILDFAMPFVLGRGRM
jgi:predicted unusual protein kinase regulating ubiquinone biosynthesis (AarF/ABC1/UbiB family)